MAIKPLVLVYQELRSTSAQIINPTLSGCVVGPHYHVRTYAEHHDALASGHYDVTNGTTIIALPDGVPGMKPKSEGFKVFLDRARVVIDSGTSGVIAKTGEFTGDSGEDFTSTGTYVKPGDTIKLTHQASFAGVASVVFATNDKKINITDLPVGVTLADEVAVGDTVAITTPAYTGVVTEVGADYLMVDTAFTANVTAQTLNVTRVRLLRDVAMKRAFTVKEIMTDAAGALIKNKLLLTTAFPFAATGVTYEITRVVNGVQVLDGAELETLTSVTTLDPGLDLTVEGVSRPVTEYPEMSDETDGDKALIYLEYKALNVKYAAVPARIDSATDVSTLLGVTDSRNPLGLGATVMFANGQATMYAIGLDSEDLTGWLKAVDTINRGKFYAQALLTNDAAIVNAFVANNVANEAPDKADYGIAIGNHRLPTTLELVATSTAAVSVDPSTGAKTILQDNNANFMNTAKLVLPGDIVMVSGVPHIVDSIINSNRLKVIVADEFSAIGNVQYAVIRHLTKDQQASSIAATSSAIKNKRCVMTWGDRCVISGQEVEGYYLNAAVGGMIIGLPPQAGITNKGIAAVEKVLNTNWDYFTEGQLDVIATGGTLIFVQDDANSLPYVRMQLTTDPTILETGEISVVKNNDYLCLYFKGIVKPYLGVWNVTPELLDALRIALNAGIDFQKLNKVAKLGAPLLDGKLQSVDVSTISPDRVEIYLDTQQPKPLNTIGLHIIV